MKVNLEFTVKYHTPLEDFKQKLCKIQIYFYVEHGENGLEKEMCEPWETSQDTTENSWVTGLRKDCSSGYQEIQTH